MTRLAAVESLRIRPLVRGETATVQAVFDGLTPDQRAQRFHTAMPRLPRSMLARLADADGLHHVVLVAEVRGRAVGLGRYIRTGDGRAEIALEVVQEWTRRGLASRLLSALRAHAEAAGLTALEFEIQPWNRAAVRMALSEDARLQLTAGAYVGTIAARSAPDTVTETIRQPA